MITLMVGNQQLVIPGSQLITVEDLHRIVGTNKGLVPSSFHLVSGEIALRPGTLLGDYPGHIGHLGMHLIVRSVDSLQPGEQPQRTPILAAERLVAPAPTSGPVVSPPGSVSHTPPTVPRESSFLIMLVFDDGRTMTQVVWPSMLIRHLCARIGEASHVSPDNVFCYYAGSVLDV
jgi:hypothetical protein